MEKTDKRYQAYIDILREELIPAMGCTEPIAVAYAAAAARNTLGELPDKVLVEASGSMIKNVKSVIVPNTDNMKGLEAAAAAGIVAGKQEKKLEVIADVTPEQTKAIRAYLDQTDIKVRHVENGVTFDIILTVWKGEHSAQVRIAVFHTNIVHVEKDGEVLVDIPVHGDSEETLTDRSLLDMEHIWDFANTVDVEDVRSILEPQIRCNMAIAEEGLRGNYGANIGSVLLDMEGNDVRVRAKAYAAAGSDARMNGCEQPVVINSGSGNQGITTSVPVIVYARELGVSDEKLLRALTLSNLTTIHERPPLAACLPTAALSARALVRVPVSPISAVVTMMPSSIRSSMHWQWFPALSAMAPRPPAQQRSQLRWRQVCWATICTSAAISSALVTALWPRA